MVFGELSARHTKIYDKSNIFWYALGLEQKAFFISFLVGFSC